jgi:hypothetical protein
MHVPMDAPGTIRLMDNARSFADVAAGIWYDDAVKFATARELFLGTSATEFSPNANMTRAMLATVLWRLENQPPATPNSSLLTPNYTDIPAGQYYTDAIAWASANGIVNGMGDGTFAPDASITREQLVTMLYRYAIWLGMDTAVDGDALDATFTDGGLTSEWAADAMRWAVAKGMVNGMGDGTLNPKGTATRAQVAVLFMRFVLLMAGDS